MSTSAFQTLASVLELKIVSSWSTIIDAIVNQAIWVDTVKSSSIIVLQIHA